MSLKRSNTIQQCIARKRNEGKKVNEEVQRNAARQWKKEK